MTLVALSVRQPWAHSIIHLGKPIENRTRHHSHRGLLLIHASAGMTTDEYDRARDFVWSRVGFALPCTSLLDLGGIIGAVDMTDSVEHSESPWWMGPRGYVLSNPRPLPFMPCKGTVTPLFWPVPAEIEAQARAALGIESD